MAIKKSKKGQKSITGFLESSNPSAVTVTRSQSKGSESGNSSPKSRDPPVRSTTKSNKVRRAELKQQRKSDSKRRSSQLVRPVSNTQSDPDNPASDTDDPTISQLLATQAALSPPDSNDPAQSQVDKYQVHIAYLEKANSSLQNEIDLLQDELNVSHKTSKKTSDKR